jgi:predicted rRNA methylase YqxC with S4 and FtsJ domains
MTRADIDNRRAELLAVRAVEVAALERAAAHLAAIDGAIGQVDWTLARLDEEREEERRAAREAARRN